MPQIYYSESKKVTTTMPEPGYNPNAVSSYYNPNKSTRPKLRPTGLGSRPSGTSRADRKGESAVFSAPKPVYTPPSSSRDNNSRSEERLTPASALYSATATSLAESGARLSSNEETRITPIGLYNQKNMQEMKTELEDYLRGTAIEDGIAADMADMAIPEVYTGETEDVTVKAGDTLTAIARDKNVSLKELIDANPQIANPDMIRPGEKVVMPSRSLTTQERTALTNVSKGVVPANVDFDFIKKREGYKLNMYIPTDKKGNPLDNSGSTIASGFDLGQRNETDLKGLPTSLIKKLKPYLGMKGSSADAYIKANPLSITDAEGVTINKFAKQQEIDRLKKDWNNSTSLVDFDDLTKGQATTVASVAFQYGDLPTRAPIFWGHVTNGDWSKAEQELRNFGDSYSSRRKLEANYLVNN